MTILLENLNTTIAKVLECMARDPKRAERLLGDVKRWVGELAAPQASAEAVYIEGGRESVDDALAVVDSFGPGIEGLNDNYARQVILATEVRRLRGIYESAVKGRQDFHSALRADRQQRGGDSKRRPYNASASLSEYGIFPECDATPTAEDSDHEPNYPPEIWRDADRQQRGGEAPDRDAVDLARRGMELHSPGMPEYIVCAELVRIADARATLAATKGEGNG